MPNKVSAVYLVDNGFALKVPSFYYFIYSSVYIAKRIGSLFSRAVRTGVGGGAEGLLSSANNSYRGFITDHGVLREKRHSKTL